MTTMRRAGIGLVATVAVAGIGLTAGLPATIAGPNDPASAQVVSERAVSAKQASRIAKRTIERRTGKSARVTDIGRENDWGAQWEVAVTLRNGREFDVSVNRNGRVVKVIRQGRDWRDSRQAGTNSVAAGTDISRAEAGRIALARIERMTGRDARVTDIGLEDDYGARWEVEVTLASGFEYDVYVDRDGDIVRVKENGIDEDDESDDDDWTPGDGAGSADREQAATAALARIEQMTGQSARVTGIDREDDYGARWEVEVTLANGFEYDVYIGADGQVIRVKENGFDD